MITSPDKPRRRKWPVLAVLAVCLVGVVAFAMCRRGGAAQYTTPTPKQNDFVRHTDIPFAPGKPLLRLDLFVPSAGSGFPVAVILHGGGWNAGNKNIHAVQSLAAWLAERGVIGVALAYRLVPHVPPTRQPHDVAAGLAWLFAHVGEYGGEQKRIFLIGHSAGAHLAALTACDRRYLDAYGLPTTVPAGVVALSNPFDLRDTQHPLGAIARNKSEAVFGDPETRALLSPLVHVRAGAPPFLILHGKGDHLVATDQALAMAAALRAVGGEAEYFDLPGRDHIGLFHKMEKPGDQAAEKTLAFIRRHAR